jgi:5-formyltetrahydrofolate cyclo-ligase
VQGVDEDPDGAGTTTHEAVRAAGRTARRAIDDAQHRLADAAVASNLLGLDELSLPAQVGWYLATDAEVDLTPAVEALRERGAQLWLPVVGAQRTMAFAPWDHDTELRPNRYGIAEPVHEAGALAAATSLDVVVVPCVAVDTAGHRIGFGAGYYDRALAEAVGVVRLGVAFEVQVVDRIEPAPWDVPLDVVVTEARVLRPDAHDPG